MTKTEEKKLAAARILVARDNGRRRREGMRMKQTLSIMTAGLMLAAGSATAQTQQGLGRIQTIYVDSLGKEEGADLVREKIIVGLARSGKVTVVDSPEKADARLIGIGRLATGEDYAASVSVHEGNGNGTASGGTTYSATAAARLIGKSGEILWAGQTNAWNPLQLFGTKMTWGSATSHVANAIVKDLLKALEKARKK